jgi:ElaB/YqjD/DUF883 family membrane-anchored ribosome-binding protein
MYSKSSEIGDKVKEAGKQAGDFAEQAADKVGKQIDSFSGLTKEYCKVVENYAQHHPLKTVGISILAGAALTIIIRGLKTTSRIE